MTTDCPPDRERLAPDLGSGAGPSDGGDASLLVTEYDAAPVLSLRRDCDVHTAILRALSLYLFALPIEHAGRDLHFASVSEGWAEVYDGTGGYPAAAIWSSEEAFYEGVPMGASSMPLATFPDRGNLLAGIHYRDEYVLKALMVRVWASDGEMRVGVRAALEDALSPNVDSAGFHLRMPHYFGALAEYAFRSCAFEDDEATAQQGAAVMTLRLLARAPRYTVHRYPAADPRTEITVGRDLV